MKFRKVKRSEVVRSAEEVRRFVRRDRLNESVKKKKRKHESKVRHFKSKKAYQKWLAYGHIHGLFKKAPGNVKVYIRGKKHKVKHS